MELGARIVVRGRETVALGGAMEAGGCLCF